jgi:hypothetical protein
MWDILVMVCAVWLPSIIRMIQVKEDKMGGACSTNGGEEEHVYIGGKVRGKETTRKTKTCGWIILRWILEG